MSLNMKIFLQSLKRLSEASNRATYAYTYIGKPLPKKHFPDNCVHFANEIEKSAKLGTTYQREVLKSIARHLKNQNTSLAQDVIDKLDIKTTSLIPKSALDFIRRNS